MPLAGRCGKYGIGGLLNVESAIGCHWLWQERKRLRCRLSYGVKIVKLDWVMDEKTECMNVKTASGAYQTNVEQVFVTGDMHRGQSLVVWTIREGREAARAVGESLM